MAQLFCILVPRFHFHPQSDFELDFESRVPFEVDVTDDGKLFVSALDFAHEEEKLQYAQILTPGLRITSINGKAPNTAVLKCDADFTVEFEEEFPLRVTFSEEFDVEDFSKPWGLSYPHSHEEASARQQLALKHASQSMRGVSLKHLQSAIQMPSADKYTSKGKDKNGLSLGLGLSPGLAVGARKSVSYSGSADVSATTEREQVLTHYRDAGGKRKGKSKKDDEFADGMDVSDNEIMEEEKASMSAAMTARMLSERKGNLLNPALDSMLRYVTDQRMAASSVLDAMHLAKECRLHNPHSHWSPAASDQMTLNTWIRVDLGDSRVVSKIRIQGDACDSECYVRTFWLDYSEDGCQWKSHAMGEMENKSHDCEHQIWPMICARFVRLRPYHFCGPRVALRFELYGFEAKAREAHSFARLVSINSLCGAQKNALLAQSVGKSTLDLVWQIDNLALLRKALEKASMRVLGFVGCERPPIGVRQHLCVFSSPDAHTSEAVLEQLAACGVGRDIGVMSVSPVTFRKPEVDPEKAAALSSANANGGGAFVRTMKSRMIVQQVVERVLGGAELTFDFVVMLATASCIAAGGLATDSAVVVVASMLVSPLMGPVLAVTFGTTLGDLHIRNLGLRNEALALALCVLVGFVYGLPYVLLLDERHSKWPTEQMSSRGSSQSLVDGVLIALPSGVGVALAVLGDYMATVVGVAISASLLPPAVNSGMLLAFALYNALANDKNQEHSPWKLCKMALFSLALVIENIIIIYVVALAMFQVKNVTLNNKSKDVWKGLRAYTKRVEYEKSRRQATAGHLAAAEYSQTIVDGRRRRRQPPEGGVTSAPPLARARSLQFELDAYGSAQSALRINLADSMQFSLSKRREKGKAVLKTEKLAATKSERKQQSFHDSMLAAAIDTPVAARTEDSDLDSDKSASSESRVRLDVLSFGEKREDASDGHADDGRAFAQSTASGSSSSTEELIPRHTQ